MGGALGRAGRITEWVFPAVPPSYDEKHPMLVRFPVADVVAEAPAMLLGLDGLPDDKLHQLGSLVSVCIIYFHSNGCDIGQCVEEMCIFRDGCFNGDAVVLCPEYPGYGLLREFEPSAEGINLMARAAWRFCVHTLGFKPSQIVLWGRSIGSGPAAELAYALATEPSAGFAIEGTARAADRAPSPRGLGNRGQGAEADAGAGPEVDPAAQETPAAASSGAGGGPRAPADPLRTPSEIDQIAEEALLTKLGGLQDVWSARTNGAKDVKFEAQVGMQVQVREAFRSDSTSRASLAAGSRGHVLRVDACGDALIDFSDHARSQWVFKSNFSKISFKERALGGLVLLAPLTSVADVVQHHLPCNVAATLVGPMWNVLSRVADVSLDSTPVLVIHPKCDEIVPSSHGRQIFEKATSRQKFGVWLCNAPHNIAIEEEHLHITRRFFSDVLGVPPADQLNEGAKDVPGRIGRDIADVEKENPARGETVERFIETELMLIADHLLDAAVSGKSDEAVLMTL